MKRSGKIILFMAAMALSFGSLMAFVGHNRFQSHWPNGFNKEQCKNHFQEFKNKWAPSTEGVSPTVAPKDSVQ